MDPTARQEERRGELQGRGERSCSGVRRGASALEVLQAAERHVCGKHRHLILEPSVILDPNPSVLLKLE